MKHITSILLAVALCGGLFGCAGCSSPTRTVTVVAGSTTITVDAAMQSWGEYVRAGKATIEERQRVRDAYVKYQLAMRVAENVTVTALTAPEGQPAAQTALNAASAASADLIRLIETFTK